MCLVIKKSKHPRGEAKTAKRNIVCYKVLKCNDDMFFTPVLWVSVSHYILSNEDFVADRFVDKMDDLVFENEVHYGIHSYRNIFITLFRLARMKRVSKDYFIYKCIIPKGSRYWIGHKFEYASDRIRFKKKLI